MSDFVEQCRREWRRLEVPDPLADEMATDLASDLREAEAEGISAEELLGTSAFDPCAFAASWAAPHLPTQPGTSSIPAGPGRLAVHAGTSAPVEWILLALAIVALGFAAWLSSWGRSGRPGVPA